MRHRIIKIVLAAILATGISCLMFAAYGCKSVDRRVAYNPDAPEAPVPDQDGAKSLVQFSDERMINWLFRFAVGGVIGIIAGFVCGYLDKAGKIPCPWWDELLVASAITAAVSLLGIWFYLWIKWLLIGGVAAYGGYRLIKITTGRKGSTDD